MNTYKIAIADDHPIICRGITTLIVENTPYEVCFTAMTKNELLQSLQVHRTDLLILDVVMPDVSATELFTGIAAEYPALSIIAYTSLNSPILIKMLFREGAKGYVNKSDPMSCILDAVDAVRSGQLYISEQYRHLVEKKSEPYEIMVSKRELDVLLLIAEQLTTAEIADRLFISPNTVESHRKKLLEKFQVDNIAGLIREAMRRGYLQ